MHSLCLLLNCLPVLLVEVRHCILCHFFVVDNLTFRCSQDEYLGPAVLMQAYRWIADSRDSYAKERLEVLQNEFSVYRCHSAFYTCPAVCRSDV